jgi:inorganic pyrophosphatase
MDADEWRRWERRIADRGVVIDRPRGHAHPLYADMIYPCDYGHVPGTAAADGEEVDVFVGAAQTGLVGLIDLTHAPSGVSEPKLLVGLSRADADDIIAFLDRGDAPPRLHLVWRDPAA